MPEMISAKQLRAQLREVVEKVRQGGRFTVLYRSRPAFNIVPVGSPSIESAPLELDPLYRARSLFFRYRDTKFSFTDCCSFVLMQELRIRRALTLDHHFRQVALRLFRRPRVRYTEVDSSSPHLAQGSDEPIMTLLGRSYV